MLRPSKTRPSRVTVTYVSQDSPFAVYCTYIFQQDNAVIQESESEYSYRTETDAAAKTAHGIGRLHIQLYTPTPNQR